MRSVTRMCDVVAALGLARTRLAAAEPIVPSSPGCTVAVCTYLRPTPLARLLDSVLLQDVEPAEVIVVDASPDDFTERMVRSHPLAARLGARLSYLRVTDSLRGLTRQRNAALRLVVTDLVAFFDDDIVLERSCLSEMERVHRSALRPVGVSAYIANASASIPVMWRLRRALFVVPTLRPGTYCRSGWSIPWAFLRPGREIVPGDFLPGGATMWHTHLARSIGFNEQFAGYGSAEDLEFSLRIGRHGRLVVSKGARVEHLHDPTGRPNDYALGYMSAQNSHRIHSSCLPSRRRRDVAWFWYALVVDSLLRMTALARPTARHTARAASQFLRGRLQFLLDTWWRRRRSSDHNSIAESVA